MLLLLVFVGTWLSSRRSLAGLSELKRFNDASNLASRAAENIRTAREVLEKASADPTLNISVQRTVYQASYRQARGAIEEGEELLSGYEPLRTQFTDALLAVSELNRTANHIFAVMPVVEPGKREELKTDLLLVRQFELDATESLRKAHLETGRIGSEVFTSVYALRFLPLMVTLLLSAVFSGFILTTGLSTTSRLKSSVGNLIRATDKVARGDLNVQVPVLKNDEIGRLSFAFDEMVRNLDRSISQAKQINERMSRLQKITAEFSRALDPKAVADIVVGHGAENLGAVTAVLAVIDDDGTGMRILSSRSKAEELLDRWSEVPLNLHTPLSEAVRNQSPLFLESKEAILMRFPELPAGADSLVAAAIVPLYVGGSVLGALSFRFAEKRMFSLQDREFVLALAALASQAFQRAALYEQATKAIAVRDEFLSIASHELKTPLTSLRLQLEIAQRQVKPEQGTAPSPERLAKVFGVATAQVDKLNSLVEDLLDVSRIELGKLTYEFQKEDLREIVRSVTERFADALRAQACPLTIEAPEPIEIRCDRFRMEQVVTNLLSNAMKYGPGGPIRISLAKAESKARLAVSDSGIGIPEDKLELIFNRFERAADKSNVGGLGLGLYISREIVRAHGGDIRAISELGKGSTFLVELPEKGPESGPA